MMMSAQIVETSANVITSLSPFQDYTHPDDHTLLTNDATHGFKPFTEHYSSTILQHMSNELPSPRIQYPGLAATIKKFLKKTIGIGGHFPRQPLMAQDVEHLIDTCGIDTPQALQSELNTSYRYLV